MSKEEKVTPITYDCKRLLLEVLTHGYITDEQKKSLSTFFDVETVQMVYVTSRDNLEDIRRLYDEMNEEARKAGLIPDTLTTFDERVIYGKLADKDNTN